MVVALLFGVRPVPSRVVVTFLPTGSPLFARSPIPPISPAHAHVSSCAHMPPPMAPGYPNENSESYLANLLENCHAIIVNPLVPGDFFSQISLQKLVERCIA